MAELLTIGYEGKTIEEFILCLSNYGVTRLIDIRESPFSWKKDFSQSRLKKRLKSKKIEYVWLKALGSPRLLRKKLKEDQDYDFFFEEYAKYLVNNKDALEELYQYLDDGVNCLMCLEQDPRKCHRSIIAEKIKKLNGGKIKIIHI